MDLDTPAYSQPVIIADEDPYDYTRPSQRQSLPDSHQAAASTSATNITAAAAAGSSLDFDRDGSIATIQTQLTSGYGSPITIHPDLFADDWTPMKLTHTQTALPTSTAATTTTTASPSYRPQNVVALTRDRGTPKALLDSPIYYLNKSSLPTRRPVADYPTPWTPSPTPTITTTVADSAARPEKTPRQIIIPYTSHNLPSPFQQQQQQQPSAEQEPVRFQNFDSSAGWSVQSHHNDPHDSQESKVVTATAPPADTRLASAAASTTSTTFTTPRSTTTTTTTATADTTTTTSTTTARPSTTKYLTKIKASSLRDLLQKEKRTKPAGLSQLDIDRLQKNIDVWTEQEFGELGAVQVSPEDFFICQKRT